MRKRRRLQRSIVLMPASALFSREPLEQQAILGPDLIVIVPTAPSRLRNIILSVAAGAMKRGWKVRVVQSPM